MDRPYEVGLIYEMLMDTANRMNGSSPNWPQCEAGVRITGPCRGCVKRLEDAAGQQNTKRHSSAHTEYMNVEWLGIIVLMRRSEMFTKG